MSRYRNLSKQRSTAVIYSLPVLEARLTEAVNTACNTAQQLLAAEPNHPYAKKRRAGRVRRGSPPPANTASPGGTIHSIQPPKDAGGGA
jgi:hypothetical protein